jgi:hypothetical protein
MANALYNLGRQAFLDGNISWSSNNIKAMLVDTALYTVNLSTHSVLTDVTGSAIVATSSNLGSKTVTDGVADAADVVFSSVSGATVEAIVIYQDTGVAGTSRLIAYIDTAVGLPATPSGGNITVVWDNGASKIFKL